MNRDFVLEHISQFRYDAYFYTSELFTRRIHEEKYRCGELGTQFCLLEIPYDGLIIPGVEHEIKIQIWREFLSGMHSSLRGSDSRGFLPKNSGIGVLFLDSGREALEIFLSRMRSRMNSAQLDPYLNGLHESQVEYSLYPIVEGDAHV